MFVPLSACYSCKKAEFMLQSLARDEPLVPDVQMDTKICMNVFTMRHTISGRRRYYCGVAALLMLLLAADS